MILDRKVTPESVKVIDMGLTNKCNLRCPLCTYTVKEIYRDKFKYIDLKEYLNFMDKLPNLNTAIIEGNYSEPTFYPYLPEVIKYLKKRGVRIRLSTNGSTRNTQYWEKLGRCFDSNDVVRYSIDGSTQEIYSKYRVGGNLQKILKNHRALKENSEAVTVLQNVIFEYNEKDKEEMKKLFHGNNFDYLSHIKCYSTAGRNDDVFKPIKAIDQYHKLYNRSVHDVKNPTLICDSYRRKEIYVNHKGQVFLCGTLEESKSYDDKPYITDDLEVIFEDITKTANNIYNNDICRTDCNLFCYTVGEKHPDMLIDKSGHVKEMNYFSKELDGEECTIQQLI